RSYDRPKREYTPLNTPLSTILMEVRSSGVLRNPPPMIAQPSHRNMNQYCQFHRDYGHSTDQCRSLQNEVESLIRRVYMGKCGGRKGAGENTRPRDTEARTRERAASQPTQPLAGVIKVILKGETSKAKKQRQGGELEKRNNQVRPPKRSGTAEAISFSYDD